MKRRAFTLVELLVASGAFLSVLGVLLHLLGCGMRMSRSSGVATTIESALAMEETLAEDIRQLVPGQGPEGYMLLEPERIAFFRPIFREKSIELYPVRYFLTPTPAGNFKLHRSSSHGGETELTALLRSLQFSMVDDRDVSAQFLKVAYQAIDCDASSGSFFGARVYSRQILFRIHFPVQTTLDLVTPTTQFSVVSPLALGF